MEGSNLNEWELPIKYRGKTTSVRVVEESHNDRETVVRVYGKKRSLLLVYDHGLTHAPPHWIGREGEIDNPQGKVQQKFIADLLSALRNLLETVHPELQGIQDRRRSSDNSTLYRGSGKF